MKKLFLSALCIAFLSNGLTQSLGLDATIFFEDALGRKDSVRLGVGLSEFSTLGIDTIHGELNIFGVPFDSLDARVIQRDSLNYNCLRKHMPSLQEPLYFPENIDSKIDFRPHGEYYSVHTNFEILLHATDYPVLVTSNIPFGSDYDQIYLLDSNCNVSENTIFYDDWVYLTLPDSSFTTLVVQMGFESGVKEEKTKEPIWKVSPNPTWGWIITVSGLDGRYARIEIVNTWGRVLKILGPNKLPDQTINIADFLPGVYFIRVIEENEGFATVRKFVKN